MKKKILNFILSKIQKKKKILPYVKFLEFLFIIYYSSST
jgi:hypothetical protein